MRLTHKLLGYLNRVFDKNAKAFLALRFVYAGAMTWTVADGVLTTTVVGGPGQALSIRLADYTLQGLIDHIAVQTGYTVLYADPLRRGLNARVLMDGADSPANSNGDHLFGYTSLLWAFLEASASELTALELQGREAIKQLVIQTANDSWLDENGAYYGVVRKQGESDEYYGPRIIAETLRPRGNNVAMEMAIQAYTGHPASVVDVVTTGGTFPLHNGAIHYDGAHVYDTGEVPRYALFDVTYTYDLLTGQTFDQVAAALIAIINQLRDAGTFLRKLILEGSAIGDEALDPPTDGEDHLVASFYYMHDAARTYGNIHQYMGNYLVDQSLDGTIIYSAILFGLAIDGEPVLEGHIGSAYGFDTDGIGSSPPYFFELVGPWPAGSTVDPDTGEVSAILT